MRELFFLLDRVTDSTVPVYLSGESGSGKELCARAIHFHGPRGDKPFVFTNLKDGTGVDVVTEFVRHAGGLGV